MRYRTFGATDIELSALTFGSMRFAPKTPGADATAGKRALEAALASGINAVHSSFEYGTRWALGEVLRDHPKRLEVQHIIKAPVPEFDEAGFSEASFRRMVEDALRETGAERIAIVQHLQRGIGREVINDARGDPDRLAAMPEVNEKLAVAADRLKAEGKIGALACFPYTEGFAGPAIASGIFDGVIAYFSLVETELVPHLPAMRERNMGFVTMRPLLQGLLTDKRRDRTTLPPDDPKRGPTFDEAYRRLQHLEAELGPELQPLTTAAIRFALADPLTPSVILSMNTEAQVEAALAAAAAPPLPADIQTRVHALNTASSA